MSKNYTLLSQILSVCSVEDTLFVDFSWNNISLEILIYFLQSLRASFPEKNLIHG
jgi:hypothetical protein